MNTEKNNFESVAKEIKNNDLYWEVDGNYWNKAGYTLEEAKEKAETMTDSINCIDCRYCRDCEDCVRCSGCRNVVSSMDCTQCRDCQNCDGCIYYENCTDGTRSDEVGRCDNCRYLTDIAFRYDWRCCERCCHVENVNNASRATN